MHWHRLTSFCITEKAEISNYKPLCSQKAVFLSVHGGAKQTDPVSGAATNIGIVLCYVVPIKQSGGLQCLG